MKKLTLSILSLIFVLCATVGLTACGKEKHTHSFTEQKAEQQYLASAATCTEAAKYYYSCACGEKGTQTFTSGNALGHKFTNYVSDNNATCTTDGTKTATCDHKGCNETDTITDAGSKLPHTYDKQVASEKYLASAATCTEAAKYYYSCACGEKGTQTFTSGNPNGHTYSEEWSQSTTEHWHAATCGHNVESGRAKHNFDENKKCTVCDYVTTQPLGLELQSTSFEVNLSKKTAYLKVTNAVTDYDFSDKFTVADGARFDVCTDKQCNNKIASKKSDIVAGDNVFYILVTNGNDVASYTVTLRRRPIYTVTFDTNGGSEVESQQVEEDSFATEPTTTKKGYNFVKWNYDFSTPILQNQTITASWNIITYNITYELNGGENSENNPTTYTVEDEIALSLPTKTGYTGTWSSGGKIEKGSIGDITFTASYTINQYKVTVTPSISGICTINNAGTYDYNTFVTLEITDVYLGYEFVGWYNGETLLSTDNVYVFTVPAKDVTISAKLSVKEEMQIYNFSSTANSCEITSVKDITITSAVIPDYVTSIGSSATFGYSSLRDIYYTGDIAGWCSINGLGTIMSSSRTLYIAGKKVEGDFVIPNGVVSISSCAFYGRSGLTSIIIPDSVTSIGNYAFRGCSGLKSITLPFIGASKTASNGYDRVLGCIFGYTTTTKSSAIVSGATYQYRENYTTYYHYYIPSSLQNVILSDNVTNIPRNAFYNCNNLTNVTFGSGITSIGYEAFYGCSGLTSIEIPDSVTSIGSSAFYNCSGLTSVTIGNSVTSIGSSAFNGCSGLTSITIPDSVTSIGDGAFSSCSGLTSIEIPDSITSIGSSAFYYCSGIESIAVSSDNTKYHSNGNCLIETESKTLILGCENSVIPTDGSVTSIGYEAFSGCTGLTSITIPDSVTSIGSSAFYYCSGLTSITIPDSVTYIGDGAFYGCSRLKRITLPFIGKSKTAYRGYDQVLGYIFGYTKSDSGSVASAIDQYHEDYEYYYYYIPSSLQYIILSDNVTDIPRNAFYNCDNLTNVTFGSGVTSIGSYAFNWCSGLKSIIIPNGVIYIHDGAFQSCKGLTSVTIPDSVTSIGSYAFAYCSGLTSITIPDSVTFIGDYAFRGCSELTKIHFNGTMEQWDAIEKDANWDYKIDSYTIYCTDGNIKK